MIWQGLTWNCYLGKFTKTIVCKVLKYDLIDYTHGIGIVVFKNNENERHFLS